MNDSSSRIIPKKRGAASSASDGRPDKKPKPKVQAVNALLSKSPVRPVILLSRSATKEDLLEQREAAAVVCGCSSRAPPPARDPPPVVRRGSSRSASRAPVPIVRRMSGISEQCREALISGLEEASSSALLSGRAAQDKGSAASLHRRLLGLGLYSQEMESDGACQFRALAHQLLGNECHHSIVREIAVAHMQRHGEFFRLFFEGRAFESYVSKMAKPTTWGDELTLRAATEAFDCVAHVITSESSNWYLVYRAEACDDADVKEVLSRAGLRPPPRSKDVFLSYVSPIHYNAIAALEGDADGVGES